MSIKIREFIKELNKTEEAQVRRAIRSIDFEDLASLDGGQMVTLQLGSWDIRQDPSTITKAMLECMMLVPIVKFREDELPLVKKIMKLFK